jgi:hypothetical protein
MTGPAEIAWQSTREKGDGGGLGPGVPPDSHDTFSRTMGGRIIVWPASMEARYGFTSEQAVGQISHTLLRTTFPTALRDIEASLVKDHRWCGGLINRHADGRAIAMMSQWDLGPKGNGPDSAAVTETY